MFTTDPADKHYGEKRQLSAGVPHVNRQRYALSQSAPGNNPLNWQGYEPQVSVNPTPYGDTTLVNPQPGLVVTRGAQQRVIPQRGLNVNIGGFDANPDGVLPNAQPLGMSTAPRLGGGPQRNVPKA